ncbi:hypothetical protein Q8F55_004947 [Vanrija albida]|uniref:Uncharacterized protein n=1 Tax=Vanrija albida TaxID=181172 RepID=A0ABR3Q095_9TREE
MGFQPLRRKDSRAILKLPVHLTCELNNEVARRDPGYAHTVITEFVRCNTPKWALTAKRRAGARRAASGKLEEVEREVGASEFANEFRAVRSAFHLPPYAGVVGEGSPPPSPPTPIAEAMAKLTAPAHRRADSDSGASSTLASTDSDTLTPAPYLELAWVPLLGGEDAAPRSWRDARACSVYLPRAEGSRGLPPALARAVASRAYAYAVIAAFVGAKLGLGLRRGARRHVAHQLEGLEAQFAAARRAFKLPPSAVPPPAVPDRPSCSAVAQAADADAAAVDAAALPPYARVDPAGRPPSFRSLPE